MDRIWKDKAIINGSRDEEFLTFSPRYFVIEVESIASRCFHNDSTIFSLDPRRSWEWNNRNGTVIVHTPHLSLDVIDFPGSFNSFFGINANSL